MIYGNHGFSDPFSKNYYYKSCRDGEKLVSDFLNKVKTVP